MTRPAGSCFGAQCLVEPNRLISRVRNRLTGQAKKKAAPGDGLVLCLAEREGVSALGYAGNKISALCETGFRLVYHLGGSKIEP